MEERLQKLISACGLASRRAAEEWIAAGRVTVNGEKARLGDRADLDRDAVLVDGRPLSYGRDVPANLHKRHHASGKSSHSRCCRSRTHDCLPP